MFILPKRFAAIFVSVALLGAVDTIDAGRHLDAGCASPALTDYTDSAPAAPAMDRVSARLFASAPTERRDNVHPAVAGSRAVAACAERAVRVGCESIGAPVSTPIRLRGDRGPPPHILS